MIRSEKNFDYLKPKGNIFLGFSKVHETLILVFCKKGCGVRHIRLFSQKMRQCFQKIKILDRAQELKDFDFLRPNGKISCETDQHFNVL